MTPRRPSSWRSAIKSVGRPSTVPGAYNAFSPTMEREICDTWRAFRRDDDIRSIVLTAAGDKAFCVGIDREEGEFTALEGSRGL